jgi:hypothetical protein
MPIAGATRYLMLANEMAWGEVPQTPDYQFVPVTDYSVRFRPQNRQSTPFVGLFQRRHSRNYRGLASGRLTCPLYGWRPGGLGQSLAQYLIDWAFSNPEHAEPPSKLAEWAEGPNVANKRHTGLRVNTAVLRGSAESGTVECSLDLMGRAESPVGTAQPLPTNLQRLVEMEFPDVQFQLGGAPVGIRSFELQLQHGLRAEYLNSFTPAFLVKTQRSVTLQVTLSKESDAWDAARRSVVASETTGQLVLRGLHGGTGTTGNWTVGTFAFPRLAFVDADEESGMNDVSMQPLSFVALKPDTSSADVAVTWSEAV